MYKCKLLFVPVSHHGDFPETQSRFKTHPAGKRSETAPELRCAGASISTNPGHIAHHLHCFKSVWTKTTTAFKPTWWLREGKGKSAAERLAGIWGNTALFFCILSKCLWDAGAEFSACLLMMHTYISGSLIAINPMRLAPCSGEMLDWAGTETADSLFLRVIAFLHSSPPPSQVRAAHIRLPFIVSINVLSGCWVNTSIGSRPACSSHHSFLSKLLFNDALVWG